MPVNKIIFDNKTLIDLTNDTITADKLLKGYTAHDKSGETITGTYEVGSSGGSSADTNLIDELISGTITNITTNAEEMRESAFSYCELLEEVNAPNCKGLYATVFSGCSSMIIFNAPLIEYIGLYAFYECGMLGELYFPNANYLEDGAFQACFSLSTITLGAVDYLPYGTFLACYSLTDVYLGYDGVVSIEYGTFEENIELSIIRIHVKSAYASAYANATNWAYYIENGFVEIVEDYEE